MLPTKEDIKTEFKQSFIDEAIVALVAFANAKGGNVYVGISDDGTVCGVRLGKETIQKWLNDIKQKTEPSIIPDIDIIETEGKTVVVLSIQEYPVKPVAFKGRYYVRQTNSNHLMTTFEISNAILKTKNSSWDFYTDPQHTIDDIDLSKVQFCINKMNRRGISIEETPVDFLRKKDFINGHNISFGGYLLFKAREDIMTTVELGFFQDSDGIIIKDSARLKNCLVSQVDDVMDYVKKH
ncbi:MAG: putative DNA binding domain-containing protein, partial [Bacteroidales bacterium]|nr:putative DNA binding domain-containing protein [Bacteroidales bacterium]